MQFPKSHTSWIVFVLGLLLMAAALLLSHDRLVALLVEPGSKDLSWGPNVFRGLLFLHGGILAAIGLGLGRTNGDSESVKSDESEIVFTGYSLGILIGLTIVGLLLRLWNLNSDLWIDEVLTLLDFVRVPVGEIVTSFPSQNQHMLFSVMARASTQLFGESAWAFRLPAVLFGLGSIWAIFLLCRRLVGQREALLAAGLMTFSYHHIWFSQNARGYTGLLFFTLLATWLWFEALRSNKWLWWFAYSAAIVGGMWIHMTMAFVVAAHGLVYLAFLIWPRLGEKGFVDNSAERRSGFRPWAAWLLSVTVTLQLYALALPEFLRIGLHEESRESEWTNPLWVITESLQGLSIGFSGLAVVMCAFALVAFGWLSLFSKNRRLAVLSVLPAVMAGTMMVVLQHNIWPRFFFFSMGFGILIVIHGALELPQFVSRYVGVLRERTRMAVATGAAMAVLMIVASVATLPKNYALPKQDFSGAKQYIDANRRPGDQVIAVGLADVIYSRYMAPDWPGPKTGSELETLGQNREKTWLVYTIPIELKAFRPDLWQVVLRDYEIVQVFPGTLNGGEVFVCQSRGGKENMNDSNSNIGKSENAAVRKIAHPQQ